MQVFCEFGFAEIGLKESDFLEENVIIEIGREPMKIQVLTGIDGVSFDLCHPHRVWYDDGGMAIPFISLDDLIANKAATARPKDRIDVEELRRIREEKGGQENG